MPGAPGTIPVTALHYQAPHIPSRDQQFIDLGGSFNINEQLYDLQTRPRQIRRNDISQNRPFRSHASSHFFRLMA